MTGHTTEVSIVVVAVQSRQDAHNNIYLSRYRHRYIQIDIYTPSSSPMMA